MAQPLAWQDRIVGLTREDPASLLANPWNWRGHTHEQEQTLDAVLTRVGLVAAVLVNDRTGHMLDGHLRAQMAISQAQPLVPVIHLDLSEEEEQLVLSTYDPIGGMAWTDSPKFQELLSQLPPWDASTTAALDVIAQQLLGTVLSPEPTDAYHTENPFAGRAQAQQDAALADPAADPDAMRVIQLFLTPAQYAATMAQLRALGSTWATDTVTDTVLHALAVAAHV